MNITTASPTPQPKSIGGYVVNQGCHNFLQVLQSRLLIFTLHFFSLNCCVKSIIKHAGDYSIRWDTESRQSRVYYYQLVVGDFTETTKMVVLK